MRGFSLIELVITLAIIALLSVIVVPVAEIQIQRKKEDEFRRALWEIRTAIDAYKKAADEGRIENAINASGYPPNLDVLQSGVKDLSSPADRKIYFLRKLPADPFASPNAAASSAATWRKRSYSSSPDAPQEGDDVFDVYTYSDKIGLNGVPYKKW